MKKTTLNISMVAALCVFCAAGTNAFGAGSVRALGGAGTYNGTTAATASSTATRAAGAMRAGSLRVSPSTSRSVSATTQAVNTTGTAGNAQRLSIGKYLGGPTSVSTTGGSGSAATINDITEIKNNITAINENTKIIENEIKELQDGKQDKLSAGDYITISNDGTVDIDLNELKDYMENNLNLSGDIEIAYESDTLKWSKDGGTTWTTLFTLNDIVGDYVSIADLETKIDALAKYATKDELAAKADKSDVYTKAEVDAAIEAGIDDKVDLSTYATKDELAAKADKTSVDKLSGDLTDLSSDVTTNTTNITTLQTTVNEHTTTIAGKANQSDVDALKNKLDGLSGTGEGSVDEQIKSALADYSKTDAFAPVAFSGKYGDLTETPDLSTYATKDELAAKADKTSVDKLSGDLTDLSSDVTTNTTNITTLQTTVNEHTTTIAGKANQSDVDALKNKLDGLSGTGEGSVDEQIKSALADYSKTDAFAPVAFSGKYGDLTETPDLSTYATKDELADKADKTSVDKLSGDLIDLSSDVTTNTTNITTLQTTVNEHTTILERAPNADAPTDGQYVWGYVNGVGQYIKVVGASGN